MDECSLLPNARMWRSQVSPREARSLSFLMCEMPASSRVRFSREQPEPPNRNPKGGGESSSAGRVCWTHSCCGEDHSDCISRDASACEQADKSVR